MTDSGLADRGTKAPDGASRTIAVSESLDDFAALWPTAAGRGAARCLPFQCADVLRVWCDTLGRSRSVRPLFAAVHTPRGKPAMLLPLGIEQQAGGVRVLRFLDAGVSDYNAPVVFPAAAAAGFDARAAWARLVAALPPFDLAVLEKMPQTVGDLPNPLAALTTGAHPDSGHAVTLEPPWEAFARARLPRWSDSRRCLRNLEKQGTVEFAIARSAGQQRRFLDALFRQKERQFVETEAENLFADPGFGEFYREATRRLGGAVLLSALTLDGRVLAANWGYVVGDRYYDLMTSNEGGEFRSFAPGRLLNEWLLEWCIREGIRVSDFGIGDESYKFRYCDVHTPLFDAHLPVTMRGTLYATLLRLRSAAKSALRDTPIGTALKAARNRLRRHDGSRPQHAGAEKTLSAWAAVIGAASLAVDV